MNIRNKTHVTLICIGATVAIAGAALYGFGFIGIGLVLLFGGTVTAVLTNADRACRSANLNTR